MGHSYWKKHHELPPKTDIVIVGGGYIGLSVAYWLKLKKPSLDICLIDSQELGEGASGRNAGFLTKGSLSFYQHLTNLWGKEVALTLYDFADESIRLVLEHFLPGKADLASSYSLYTRPTDFVFKGFRPFPPPFPGIQEAFVCSGEASINPMILLRELEESVRQKGVRILRGVEALHLAPHTLLTSYGEIHFASLVLALNGYSQSLIPGIIKPQRAQMLCAEMEKNFSLSGLIYEPEQRVYFKAVGNNRIVIGGKRLEDPLTEETSLLGINDKIQQSLENYLQERVGKISAIHARWSGIMGFTSDELPLVEKRENYYLISGFSGHGMGWGFNASRNLSDMMLDNKSSFFQVIRTSLQTE